MAGAAKPLKRAPAWMGKSSGVVFGFGGRLASFSHYKQQVSDPATGQVGSGRLFWDCGCRQTARTL
jgi:hypothetical protein